MLLVVGVDSIHVHWTHLSVEGVLVVTPVSRPRPTTVEVSILLGDLSLHLGERILVMELVS